LSTKSRLAVVLFALPALFIVSALSSGTAAAAPLPGGTLDPLTIPKYVTPLVIPPEMPSTTVLHDGTRYYEIAVRQFQQQVLPAGLPATTVWSYGSIRYPGTAAQGGTFNYPAFTIEAGVNVPTRVKWINDLKDPVTGNFLPHLLPVDQTLHWANPPGDCMDGAKGTDCRGKSPLPYEGPVPVTVHLHGAHVNPDSDGFPEAWYLPDANNIDCIDAPGYPKTPGTADDFFCRGSNFDQIKGVPVQKGAATFQYRNDQGAATLWFHDHSLGMTRTNVYAGPAGFYLLRGGPTDLPSEPAVTGGLPGPSPKFGDAPGTMYYEIPIVIQDRSFDSDGSLFYPNSRVFFDGYAGPYIADPTFASDVSPIHNSEFFGNTMVVNGNTWPYLDVEPRKYRFRILNGSDSRFLILKIDDGGVKANFTQIGAEGGFLAAPAVLDRLLVGPAERVDVIVDFSKFKPGNTLHLKNIGPDEPFGGPFPASVQADSNTTGQVMEFRVVALTAPDTSTIPALPAIPPLGAATNVRQVSLNEAESALICVDRNSVYVPGVTPPACNNKSAPLAPIMAQLGTVDPLSGMGIPRLWSDPITENPALNATEIWEISNFTEDAHPIHVHMVQFQVVNRQVIGGAVRGPEPWETGRKDTVVAFPGEITRIKAFYDIPGLFVWHCHILEHEDNEMMRPYCIGDMTKCKP